MQTTTTTTSKLDNKLYIATLFLLSFLVGFGIQLNVWGLIALLSYFTALLLVQEHVYLKVNGMLKEMLKHLEETRDKLKKYKEGTLA